MSAVHHVKLGPAKGAEEAATAKTAEEAAIDKAAEEAAEAKAVGKAAAAGHEAKGAAAAEAAAAEDLTKRIAVLHSEVAAQKSMLEEQRRDSQPELHADIPRIVAHCPDIGLHMQIAFDNSKMSPEEKQNLSEMLPTMDRSMLKGALSNAGFKQAAEEFQNRLPQLCLRNAECLKEHRHVGHCKTHHRDSKKRQRKQG